MSLNLLIGYGGLLQVAHAAYYGIGAYAAALLWTKLGWGVFSGLGGGGVAGGGVWGMIRALLKWSPFGRALQAMRDDELAARSIGIPVNWLKLQAFALASAMVGIAGGLYASYVSYIDPTSFSLNESILMLSMVIIGGTGNVRGPLTGAAVLILLPEALRFLQLPDAVAANVRLLAYGLLLVIMMHLRPQGLAGTYRYQ